MYKYKGDKKKENYSTRNQFICETNLINTIIYRSEIRLPQPEKIFGLENPSKITVEISLCF